MNNIAEAFEYRTVDPVKVTLWTILTQIASEQGFPEKMLRQQFSFRIKIAEFADDGGLILAQKLPELFRVSRASIEWMLDNSLIHQWDGFFVVSDLTEQTVRSEDADTAFSRLMAWRLLDFGSYAMDDFFMLEESINLYNDARFRESLAQMYRGERGESL